MPEDPTLPLYIAYNFLGMPVVVDLSPSYAVAPKGEPSPPVEHDPANDPELERAKVARLI